jgi:hypothetical protein
MHEREARFGEGFAKARFELRREADLGNENERLHSALQRLRYEVQVNLGLAAAGHSMEQESVEAAGDALHDASLHFSELMLCHEARAGRL